MTKMKESGIDWIGQIPEEWEVTKLKYALLINNGKDYKDIEVEEGGYPVIGSGGVLLVPEIICMMAMWSY